MTSFLPHQKRPALVLHLKLTSGHFPDVIPATEKKSNLTGQRTLCSSKRDSRGKPCQYWEGSVLAVDDVGVVVQRYLMRVQLETDLVISHSKITCKHSVEHCVTTMDQCLCLECCHENHPAIMGNCRQDMTGCSSSVSKPPTVSLQAFPGSPGSVISGIKTEIVSSENKTDLPSVLQ
ncbi:hypothetical protein TNCV_2743841 [Trichonephila clavipes]|nr:hypothetical protein TNCV_2743841 [Trichonephila clavipes]